MNFYGFVAKRRSSTIDLSSSAAPLDNNKGLIFFKSDVDCPVVHR